jgi:hypothetical protein
MALAAAQEAENATKNPEKEAKKASKEAAACTLNSTYTVY